MEKAGHRTTAFTYMSLLEGINVCVDDTREDLFQDLWVTYEKFLSLLRISIKSASPDTFTNGFNACLSCMLKRNDLDKGKCILQDMERFLVPHDSTTLALQVHLLLHDNPCQPLAALAIWKQMHTSGQIDLINTRLHNSMLQELSSCLQVSKGDLMFVVNHCVANHRLSLKSVSRISNKMSQWGPVDAATFLISVAHANHTGTQNIHHHVASSVFSELCDANYHSEAYRLFKATSKYKFKFSQGHKDKLHDALHLLGRKNHAREVKQAP